ARAGRPLDAAARRRHRVSRADRARPREAGGDPPPPQRRTHRGTESGSPGFLASIDDLREVRDRQRPGCALLQRVRAKIVIVKKTLPLRSRRLTEVMGSFFEEIRVLCLHRVLPPCPPWLLFFAIIAVGLCQATPA